MRKSILCMFIAAAVATSARAATISYDSGDVGYDADTPWGHLHVNFKKCMNNDLYTFSDVSLDGNIVNTTIYSNNIGGFLANGWWMGGNHNDGKHNSETVSVTIAVDGKIINTDTVIIGDVLTVNVENDIFYADGKKFCSEYISYNVSGNSIEIHAEHHYCHPYPLTVDRYYGMQSVFVDETEILTPGGQCRVWTPLTVTNEGNEIQFSKSSAPDFCTFIEHSANGYQATYMERSGLGARVWIDDDTDVVYIGNSWSKGYHKLIGNHTINNGDVSQWRGVYSWFRQPITDGCRTADGNGVFEYGAYIDGKPLIMHINPDGTMSEPATN